MARPLRIEFPGALYHVTTRGMNTDSATALGPWRLINKEHDIQREQGRTAQFLANACASSAVSVKPRSR
ncbi:MAG: hypothetical protein OJF50_001673 [Nitrospira sp.]|jgi:hypothetical protein|nr:hypothetical protein [Nitrospira sp.]